MKTHNIQTQLTQVCNALEPWRESFPSEIEAIQSLKADAATKLQRFSQDELHLSIGIMGQVKAGKSSFLNALLFDGQSILPEAATPKTANLTRITWGETPTLTVTFYTPTEWSEIERVAASAGSSPEARVGRDLLAMVRLHELDVPQILAQGTLRLPAKDVSNLLGRLNDYVGENGKCTPLVKMTEQNDNAHFCQHLRPRFCPLAQRAVVTKQQHAKCPHSNDRDGQRVLGRPTID
jgi:hypothetical protein